MIEEIYINSRLTKSEKIEFLPVYIERSSNIIGKSNNPLFDPWKGLIDDF
jgi:hypothetical protein